jgi:DNA mismatch repair protein MutS2
MIYPHNFEQKIGFDSIRLLLKDMCISDMGMQFVDKIRFAYKPDIVNRLLNQVNEFVEILTIGKSFPNQDYFDLRDELLRIKTPGSYIEQEVLFDLSTSLRTIESILHYLKKPDKSK